MSSRADIVINSNVGVRRDEIEPGEFFIFRLRGRESVLQAITPPISLRDAFNGSDLWHVDVSNGALRYLRPDYEVFRPTRVSLEVEE